MKDWREKGREEERKSREKRENMQEREGEMKKGVNKRKME